MTNSPQPRREVVGIFSDRAAFDAAVQSLQAAGFDRTDLSVLASHESIDAAKPEAKSWKDAVTALIGELKYQGPLLTAGFIAVAAGPVGAAIAAVIAAGVGGAAAKELMDEVTARPHAEQFARALAAGSLLVWVYVADADREAKAITALQVNGAANVHVNERQG